MIKIRNSNKTYDVKVDIISWRSIIQLTGEELPITPVDFDVLNDEGVVIDYFVGFNVVYDSGEGYIQFTNDTNTYYNYLIYNENNYVIDIKTTTEETDENGYFLYQSGQGKQYKCFTMTLFDDVGFYLYKIKNNKLTKTSETEKQEYNNQLLAQKIIDAKVNKIDECKQICNKMIINGMDVEIDGNVEHFSYKDEDQINIKELFDLSVQTNVSTFYHADNCNCRAYTTEEIIKIYASACQNKNHHTTYFNQLKQYILTLETLEEIEAVEYGQELFGEYLETYNASMAQAQTILETLLVIREASL